MNSNDDFRIRMSPQELSSTKMESFHSSQSQCCCCVVAVLVSLGGVIMTSIGVCLILNYDMINTDILPPELQTGEGKKIIGIILICFGITGVVISSLVSILFFTICHTTQSPQTISPMFYDGRKKDNLMWTVDRSAMHGVMSGRTNRAPYGVPSSTSTPRKGYPPKKKKMVPTVLESVKEDPIVSCPNGLPILQINGANYDGSVCLSGGQNGDSGRLGHWQNSSSSLEKDSLKTGSIQMVDAETISGETHSDTINSEINSSKL